MSHMRQRQLQRLCGSKTTTGRVEIRCVVNVNWRCSTSSAASLCIIRILMETGVNCSVHLQLTIHYKAFIFIHLDHLVMAYVVLDEPLCLLKSERPLIEEETTILM